VCSVEKKERARLKTVKFNAKSRDRGVSAALLQLFTSFKDHFCVVLVESEPSEVTETLNMFDLLKTSFHPDKS